jgi:cytochrome c556
MPLKTIRNLTAIAFLVIASAAVADDDPRHERHELMEDVGDAAKVIGGMLKGERAYDAAAFMAALVVFQDVSKQFGDLFPAGSETGMGTEAAPAIWEDRAGFDAALVDWQNAVTAAIEANPGSLDEAKPAAGPVFKTCKACHDSYRIEDE